MYYNKEIKEVEKELNTSKTGLNTIEAKARIEKYGKNIIPKKQNNGVFKIFINEFKDPIVILLLISSIISFLAGEKIDAITIIFIVLVDVIMGTYQENKANKTAQSLANLVADESKVIRDNKIISIPATDLTIGDYVLLESGDKISADLRIVESHNLMIDESILTGESTNVFKNSNIIAKTQVLISEQSNMAFAGTSVVCGRGKGIVVAIGLNTEIGKIASSMNDTIEEKSPLTIRIEKLSKQISILVSFIAIIIAILLIIKGVPYSEIFVSVIALAVSAMPEGLPLALTMALTIASNKMAKKNVIVRKLNSAESLGSCTVIASDKTGTLTVNEQTAKKIVLPNNEEYSITGTGYDLNGEIIGHDVNDAKEIATLGVINNEAILNKDKMIGDSIDLAFLVLGKKLGIKTDDIKILETIPYESENRYSAVFYEQEGSTYCTVKGSLEVVKSFCNQINLTNKKLSSNILEEQNDALAKDGYRVIALAKGKIKKQEKYDIQDIKDLAFMGMVGFIDPIRKEAATSIKECQNAGIKVLMITGDHPLTAYAIAKDLKLVKDYNEITTGSELENILKEKEEVIDNYIKQKKVFARVTPIQKLKIVESLKRQGEFVAVTGDGVNDAPALKSANIGIAMGSGTDIARDTADMIILDDNFTSIVSGIKEGRTAYANIRKIIYFLISCGLAEVIFFCLSIIWNLPMPLVAIQLLWLNMVTDGIQDFALSFEQGEKDILNEKPRDPKESIFSKDLIQEILFSGLFIGLLVFIAWYYLLNFVHMDVTVARGYIMALMVFIQNIHAFNCRSEKSSVFSTSVKSNKLIVIGVFMSILLQIIVMEVDVLSKFLQTVSIPFLDLIRLFIIAFSILIIMEIYKAIKRKKLEIKNSQKI